MRHAKKGRKLGRNTSHRQALRRNLAAALLRRERVITTVGKAKEVRPFVERIITLARRALPLKDTGNAADRARYLHYYRLALRRLQDKEMVQKLFGEGPWLRDNVSLAQRYANRPGGYTRIVRIGGSRLGVPVGGTVSEIPEITYQIGGTERTLRLTGNRLGDNAVRVIFELVEERTEAPEQEVAPAVSLGDEPEDVAE
jgi:large subunit ribosomal protein L17